MTVPIEVLRAARRWADEHGHQQPDDRMLEIVYRAGAAERIAELERRVEQLEERFQRFLETNELWDGS